MVTSPQITSHHTSAQLRTPMRSDACPRACLRACSRGCTPRRRSPRASRVAFLCGRRARILHLLLYSKTRTDSPLFFHPMPPFSSPRESVTPTTFFATRNQSFPHPSPMLLFSTFQAPPIPSNNRLLLPYPLHSPSIHFPIFFLLFSFGSWTLLLRPAKCTLAKCE